LRARSRRPAGPASWSVRNLRKQLEPAGCVSCLKLAETTLRWLGKNGLGPM
jgi:hypothetical protein